jgi:hypothetical protein
MRPMRLMAIGLVLIGLLVCLAVPALAAGKCDCDLSCSCETVNGKCVCDASLKAHAEVAGSLPSDYFVQCNGQCFAPARRTARATVSVATATVRTTAAAAYTTTARAGDRVLSGVERRQARRQARRAAVRGCG